MGRLCNRICSECAVPRTRWSHLTTDQKVRSSNLFGRATIPINPFQFCRCFSVVGASRLLGADRALSLTVCPKSLDSSIASRCRCDQIWSLRSRPPSVPSAASLEHRRLVRFILGRTFIQTKQSHLPNHARCSPTRSARQHMIQFGQQTSEP